MPGTNVCVIGPEDCVLRACIELKRAGYDVHTAQKSSQRLFMVRAADAVIVLDGDDHDMQFAGYARELDKPVYYDLGRLMKETSAKGLHKNGAGKALAGGLGSVLGRKRYRRS